MLIHPVSLVPNTLLFDVSVCRLSEQVQIASLMVPRSSAIISIMVRDKIHHHLAPHSLSSLFSC